jgi:transposase-like protein
MKKMLERFTFSEEFKEKLVLLVMYRNQSVKEVAKSYNLPNSYVFKKNIKQPKSPI